MVRVRLKLLWVSSNYRDIHLLLFIDLNMGLFLDIKVMKYFVKLHVIVYYNDTALNSQVQMVLVVPLVLVVPMVPLILMVPLALVVPQVLLVLMVPITWFLLDATHVEKLG